MIVYKITNKTNGMVYVGITTKPLRSRFHDHILQMRKGSLRALYVAMRNDGHENFEVEQIASATSLSELGMLEAEYIEKLNCFAPNGYNMTTGGFGSIGYTITEAFREKLRQAKKEKPNPPCTAETREKLSLAAMGRKMPREAVERARAARIGKKRTPEQCAAIAIGRIGKGLRNEASRKHPKAVILAALGLLKQGKKQADIVLSTGLSQPYISRLKNNHRGVTLLED